MIRCSEPLHESNPVARRPRRPPRRRRGRRRLCPARCLPGQDGARDSVGEGQLRRRYPSGEPAGRLRGRLGAPAPRGGECGDHPEGAPSPRAGPPARERRPLLPGLLQAVLRSGQSERRPGLGSGVIFDKRGLILTNFHVIKGADEITVKMADKREYTGQVVGTDPKTDLAVVRFQPDRDLTIATLGNSDALRVGEWAIAIGNPFGLDQTVTVGVISATGRSDVGVATYENFIQTDASINPGNSGGPLLNLKGEVIGINTAIFSQSGGSIGIGFAIPINMVKRVVDQLVDKGKVVRGWLGVSLQPLSPELAESLGVPDKQGAVVGSTMAGSPAAAAGLQQNDVILAYDKTPVESSQHFQRLTAETKVGSKVVLQVLRKKQKMDITVTVAEAPDEAPRRPPAAPKG